MVDERRGHRGPADDSNGGPVKPGAAPLRDGKNGNGSNGVGGPPALRRDPGRVEPGARQPAGIKHTRVAGLWAAAILSTIVLVFLLIFIVQNLDLARIRFLGAEGQLPVGIALLFAAALGVLLVAIPGFLRIMQLRRMVRRRD